MTDLTVYDFKDTFDLHEAAALIGGLDPRQRGPGGEIIGIDAVKPILDRIINELNELISILFFEHIKPHQLRTMKLEAAMKRAESDPDSFEYSFPENLRLIRFSRQELARWLAFHGLKSEYQFEKTPAGAKTATVGRWSWGNYHTKDLGYLEAAALKWWANYDPNDPTTAPTNDVVSAWLQKEFGISTEKARAIASILRADGLRTGPRR